MSGERHYIVIEKQSNKAAKVSISLAIIGFVLSLIPILGWILLPVWIMAILFGIVGLFNSYRRRLAISGILIGLFTFMYKALILQAIFGG